MKRAAVFALMAIILISGCATVKVNADIKDSGGGTALVTIDSPSEIDAQVNAYFKGKKDLQIEKQKESDGDYIYTVRFSFDKVSELSKNAKLTAADSGKSITYEYSDVLSSDSLGATGQELPDVTYCVSLPGEVTELVVGPIKDTTYNGKSGACVELTSEDKEGKKFTMAFMDKKKGCQYTNPLCDNSYDCINNNCVLKKGCQYSNPACGANYDCVNNACQLKPGCQYSNPACEANYDCADNACQLKPGCTYDNPPCEENYECKDNQCVEKPFPIVLMAGIGIAAVAVIAGIVAIIRVKK